MRVSLHPIKDLEGYDESPESVLEHFKILRGVPGGITCPEGVSFQSELRQVVVFKAYIDPRTETQARVPYGEDVPYIKWRPPGRKKDVTVKPPWYWAAALNEDEKNAADEAKAQAVADQQAFDSATEYRRKRKQDYAKELSPEGELLESIGDVLDALLEQVAELAGDNKTPKFQAIVDKVAEIKLRHQP